MVAAECNDQNNGVVGAMCNFARSCAKSKPVPTSPLVERDINGRPADESYPQPSKKPKPAGGSLVESMTKQALLGKLTCPVCNREFPTGTWMAQVNRHINLCSKA